MAPADRQMHVPLRGTVDECPIDDQPQLAALDRRAQITNQAPVVGAFIYGGLDPVATVGCDG